MTSPIALMPGLEAAWQKTWTAHSSTSRGRAAAGRPHSRGRGRVGHARARRSERSASTAARLTCVGRACAATAMRFNCLENGPDRGLAWPLGDEFDVDQRLDAQAQAGGTATRGRSAGGHRRRHLERRRRPLSPSPRSPPPPLPPPPPRLSPTMPLPPPDFASLPKDRSTLRQ